MNMNTKHKVYDYLIEDCENLAEISEWIGNHGIDIIKISDEGEITSSYDLLVKYYAGVLTGLGLVLKDLDLKIPDDLLQKEMKLKLKEINNEI